LATGSSSLSLLGLALGFAVDRRWLFLPLAVQGFYLQHALQGWCPPLPLFRRLGFRTPSEIEEERCALQALSGSHADEGGTNRERWGSLSLFGWVVLAATVLAALPVAACPLCHTETGEAVRAGIFNSQFLPTALAVLSPFPLILAVVVALDRGWIGGREG
jgi:hypothetical protein